MRAILAGGGTGGHVIPALAIAHELQKQYGAEVLFIGTARGIENRLVPAAGFPLRLVQVGALNKVSLKTRLKTLFDLPRAVWDARRILAEFQPDIVIGVGPGIRTQRSPRLRQSHGGEVGFRSGGSL
jgi:UDP-N-acetylglucosamine--N-acetylmuramyl-(pentapeptide) pyrophosphoryl-undecaprenol N-acetylglucosamine transferase